MTEVLNPINHERMIAQLGLLPEDLEDIAKFPIPGKIVVASENELKRWSVDAVVERYGPDQPYDVSSTPAQSGVNSQPFGAEAVRGALNRIRDVYNGLQKSTPEEADTVGIIAVENGLFRIPRVTKKTLTTMRFRRGSDIVLRREDADLDRTFDAKVRYQDRAVVAIKLPYLPTIVQISHSVEASDAHRSAVMAAYAAEGSFRTNTVGEMLVRKRLAANHQNPTYEMTADRPGGPMYRQEQIARTMLRALFHLSQQQPYN